MEDVTTENPPAENADGVLIDKETFLARRARNKTIEVVLSDGEKVLCRKLSQAEVEHMTREYSREGRTLEGLRYVVVKTVLEPTGRRMFGDSEVNKLQAVLDFDDVKAIATQVCTFSGLDTDAKNA